MQPQPLLLIQTSSSDIMAALGVSLNNQSDQVVLESQLLSAEQPLEYLYRSTQAEEDSGEDDSNLQADGKEHVWPTDKRGNHDKSAVLPSVTERCLEQHEEPLLQKIEDLDTRKDVDESITSLQEESLQKKILEPEVHAERFSAEGRRVVNYVQTCRIMLCFWDF
jgi:hypothetical protein